MPYRPAGALFALLLLSAAPLRADVTLAGIFGDRMVLPGARPFPVWGRADPGEKVTVSFEGEAAETTAGADGRWAVRMGPFAPGDDRELVVHGRNRIVLRVAVGEVWLCSGQSNMAWPLRASSDAGEAIAAATDEDLRLYTVPHRVADAPRDDVAGRWQVCTPATAAPFSAVAYHFGRLMRESRGVPVGLVHASWGGTPAEAWMRPAALRGHPDLDPILARWDAVLAGWPEREEAFRKSLADWQAAAEAARKAGREEPRRPSPPPGPDHPHRPGNLWHGMIAPLVPFEFQGVIWYQGESNAGRAEQYGTLFPALIRDWRAAWGGGDMPFLFVQLANFKERTTEPVESAWAELRDAQRRTLSLPATAMAVAIDVGEAGDIHPGNKREVGRRLALAGRAVVFGEDGLAWSGPLYDGHETQGGRVVLRFRHAGGLAARDGAALDGFTVAGADRRFRTARARIEGDTVVVWHADVPEPAAVRYAWADNPACNLVNGAGLPASPFRTDDWPGVTAGKR